MIIHKTRQHCAIRIILQQALKKLDIFITNGMNKVLTK
jgi:hypothetical protein